MSATDAPVNASASASASPSPAPPAVGAYANPATTSNDTDENNESATIEPTLPSMDGSNDAPDIQSAPSAEPNTTVSAENVSAKAGDGLRPEMIEPRIPAKKDATLREFLGKMDDYAPIVRLDVPIYTA